MQASAKITTSVADVMVRPIASRTGGSSNTPATAPISGMGRLLVVVLSMAVTRTA